MESANKHIGKIEAIKENIKSIWRITPYIFCFLMNIIKAQNNTKGIELAINIKFNTF